MTLHAAPSLALAISCGALAGLALGLVYFALLRRAITDYLSGAGLKGPVLLTALRFGIAAVAFWLLVQWSGAAAIAGLLGFTLAQLGLRAKAGLS
jgi:hypothetical protein